MRFRIKFTHKKWVKWAAYGIWRTVSREQIESEVESLSKDDDGYYFAIQEEAQDDHRTDNNGK